MLCTLKQKKRNLECITSGSAEHKARQTLFLQQSLKEVNGQSLQMERGEWTAHNVRNTLLMSNMQSHSRVKHIYNIMCIPVLQEREKCNLNDIMKQQGGKFLLYFKLAKCVAQYHLITCHVTVKRVCHIYRLSRASFVCKKHYYCHHI